METSELILPLIALGLIVFMLVLGLFNKVIAKLGFRNFYRHKGHAIISIAGLLVGTSIICASMVVGDSIEYFIVEETYETLGEIDMVITGDGGTTFDDSFFTTLDNNAAIGELTDGMAPLYAQGVTVRHSTTNQFEPSANLIGFDSVEDADFGEFMLMDGSGISGNDLGENDTMINQELAETLGAGEGDVIILTYTIGNAYFGDIASKTLTVKYILDNTGKTLFNPSPGMGFDTYNMFVNIDTAQNMFLEPNMLTHIKISNNGDIEGGAENSEEVQIALESALDGLVFQETKALAMSPIPGMNNTYISFIDQLNMDHETLTLSINGTIVPEAAYIYDTQNSTVMLFAPLQMGSIVTVDYEYSSIMDVDATKQNNLKTAKAFNDLISMFLTIFGSFAIIAGVILIINIFTMLAEERKSELGMARAVGMKRKHLMQSFLFEGLAYGGVASALGTLVGVIVGMGLIWMVNNFIDVGIDFNLPFKVQWFSLVSAFSLGFILTFGTILFTSWKISKLNIIRAIRGIEEPVKDKKSIIPLLLGALLTVVSVAIYMQWPDDILVQVIVPSGMIVGIGMVLWRWIGDRLTITGASLGVFLFTYIAIKTYFIEGNNDSMDILFIVSGVMIVLSMVMLIMYNSGPVIRLITGSFGRVRKWRPTIETAVSYPLTKKFRTGMSVGMFALVIYMIVMLSVFSSMFAIDIDEETMKQGGGYDIIADVQIPTFDIENVSYINPITGMPEVVVSDTIANNLTASGFAQLSRAFTMDANLTDSEGTHNPFADLGMGDLLKFSYVYGIDNSLHEGSSYEFTSMADGYETPEEVWAAITAAGSSKVAMSAQSAMFTGAQAGNHITVKDPSTNNISQEYEIIGIVDQNLMMGIFMSRENVIHDFGTLGMVNSIFMFQVDPDHDIAATARALESDFAALGMNTIVVREMAETTMETMNSMFILFELYLDMGLVVGVAGLGIITIRSVVERTPEIGILRSLGFTQANVRNAFLIEILFVATLGVLIGVTTGIMVSYEIFNVMAGDMGSMEFTIPWFKIGYVTAIAYAATILCTIIPARNAAKITPAEALRYVG
ncbi:MAG: FtsX-like permease family protein [Thermoplasmata archaeon]|nr:FtsX-like permease family protein [Thermoplasmata archaeon]